MDGQMKGDLIEKVESQRGRCSDGDPAGAEGEKRPAP
jgi:hypothetical protein